MINQQKGKASSVLFVIVTVIVVFIGGYLYLNNGNGEKTLADCEKLSNVEERNACYVVAVSKNIQLCNTLSTDSKKVACIVHSSINRKDSSFCELGENDKSKDQCYLGYAGWTKERDVCDKIQDSSYRQFCFSSINN